MRLSLAAGLLAGAAADHVWGDPRRAHPVAVFGSAAAACERRDYRDSRAAGVGHAAACVGGAVLAGMLAERSCRTSTRRIVLVALSTWSVLGGASLRREANAVVAQLDRGEINAARQQLTHLVGRDTSELDSSEIARAAVESVAENTSDAVVAPLFWGAVAGVPGLVGYRAVNTLDAMVGHRSERYRNFGWASARLDDLANVVPARLTAALVAASSGEPVRTWRAARRYARRHPSPNAGWCEAAYAGALDVRLGGANVYAGHVDDRPFLGDGKPARPQDVTRAVMLEQRVGIAAVVLAAVLAAGRR